MRGGQRPGAGRPAGENKPVTVRLTPKEKVRLDQAGGSAFLKTALSLVKVRYFLKDALADMPYGWHAEISACYSDDFDFGGEIGDDIMTEDMAVDCALMKQMMDRNAANDIWQAIETGQRIVSDDEREKIRESLKYVPNYPDCLWKEIDLCGNVTTVKVEEKKRVVRRRKA